MTNGSELPNKGWVKIASQHIKADEESIKAPILVTDFKFERPIIGYNAIEELIR